MALDSWPAQIRLDPLQHRCVLGNRVVDVDHSAKAITALRALWIVGEDGLLVGIDHSPKAGPEIWRLTDKDMSAVNESLEIDEILGPEIDQLQEFVVSDLVVDVFLDLIKERNIFRRC